MAWVCVFAVAAAAVSAGTGCRSASDCELLGRCDRSTGKCMCFTGFTGPTCGLLALLPADAPQAWPRQPLGTGAASWGFSAVKDSSSRNSSAGKFHAIVNVGCGTSATKVTGTFAALLSSDAPDRGYQFKRMVAPPTSFNPHMIQAPNGTYLLYFRVNDLDSHPICTGDDRVKTIPTPMVRPCGPGESSSTDNCVHPGSPDGPGINMYVAWSDTIDGPWNVSNVSITGCGNFHKSNPTLTYLSSGPMAGKVLLSYRFNYQGEMVAFAVSDSFRGPFRSIANLTHSHGNDEDSFVWQQPDGSLHILYHNGPDGKHAFASASGLDWTKAEGDAFTLSYELAGGGTVSLKRRERPEILFGDDGTPTHFFSAVETREGDSFSLVQSFAG